jgi:hypothetical protein
MFRLMRSRRGWRHSRAALSMAVLAASVSACAAIWGFEDGVPLRDAGDDDGAIDATTDDAGGDASAAFDATTVDDSPGATGDATDGAVRDEPPEDAQATDGDGGPVLCTGLCAPDAPTPDWQGPFAMFEVTDGAAPPACDPAGWTQAYDLGAEADAAPASCDCRCGPPSNFTCGPPATATFTDRNCLMPCMTAPRTTVGACTSLPATPLACGPNARVTFTAPVPEGGSCVSTAIVDAGPIPWEARARLCAGAGVGVCATGTCMPPSSGGETYCIARPGSFPCPDPYLVPHGSADGGTAYYADASDGRGCTCSCGAPTGLLCQTGVILFDSGTCSNTGTFIDSGTCTVPLPPFANAVATALDAGSCTPYGGPTGGITLSSSITVCCTR